MVSSVQLNTTMYLMWIVKRKKNSCEYCEVKHCSVFSYIEDCVTKSEALDLLKRCEGEKSKREKEVLAGGASSIYWNTFERFCSRLAALRTAGLHHGGGLARLLGGENRAAEQQVHGGGVHRLQAQGRLRRGGRHPAVQVSCGWRRAGHVTPCSPLIGPGSWGTPSAGRTSSWWTRTRSGESNKWGRNLAIKHKSGGGVQSGCAQLYFRLQLHSKL